MDQLSTSQLDVYQLMSSLLWVYAGYSDLYVRNPRIITGTYKITGSRVRVSVRAAKHLTFYNDAVTVGESEGVQLCHQDVARARGVVVKVGQEEAVQAAAEIDEIGLKLSHMTRHEKNLSSEVSDQVRLKLACATTEALCVL